MRDLSFEALQQIVKDDAKGRYSLTLEGDVWWIRANQGHSMKASSHAAFSPVKLSH